MIRDALISGDILMSKICEGLESRKRTHTHVFICMKTKARLKRHTLNLSKDLNLHKTYFRNHLVRFKMIKAEIYADSQQKRHLKYLTCYVCLSICRFNMSNNANISLDPKKVKLRVYQERLPSNKIQK